MYIPATANTFRYYIHLLIGCGSAYISVIELHPVFSWCVSRPGVEGFGKVTLGTESKRVGYF